MLSLRLLFLEPKSTGDSFAYTSILGNLGLTDSPCETKNAPLRSSDPLSQPCPHVLFVQWILWLQLIRFPIYEKTEIWGRYGDPRICLWLLLG